MPLLCAGIRVGEGDIPKSVRCCGKEVRVNANWSSISPREKLLSPAVDFTARHAETEDEQSNTASCMSTDPAEGRVVLVVGVNLERALFTSLMRCKRISQFPGFTDDWFSFLSKNLCQDTTKSNALQSTVDSPSDLGHFASVMEVVPEVFEAAGQFEMFS